MKRRATSVRMEKWPEELVRIADNRVKNFLLHMSWINFDLRKLIISAYCQGVSDTAEALSANEQILDYQI